MGVSESTVPVLDLRVLKPAWVRDSDTELAIGDPAPKGEAGFAAFTNRATEVAFVTVRAAQ
jgi:hypothetical protein